MTVDEIRELIHLASETGIAELEVQRGENRVRIRRTGFAGSQEIVLAPPAYATPVAAAPLPAVAASATAAPGPAAIPAPAEAGKEKDTKAGDSNRVLVKSPIVGTFYEGPSPGSPPFVRVGERVQPGKVLCIIESMKLMNEIEAETSGIIESKLVMNGQPVEYGEALFAIRAV
jgi:acetyl-CoA carboxylase biotin carboxyl carrier protein